MPNHDPEEITAWVREHGRQLVLYARQWVGQHADAEDIVQEAFVRFWPHRDRAQQPIAYLYRCVRNVAMNWQRDTGRRQAHEAGMFREIEAADETDRVEQVERQETIDRALSELPQEHREIVVMKIWAGLDFRAIGETMNLPHSTVYLRYQQAMGMLESRLGKATL